MIIELEIHFDLYYESTTNSRVRVVAIELERNRVRYPPIVLDVEPTSDLKSSLVVLELGKQLVRGGGESVPCYIELDLLFELD